MLWTRRSHKDHAAARGGLLLTVVALAATSCSVIAGHAADRPLLPVTRLPAATSVFAGSPRAVAARAASALFARAPLVVLASAGRRAAVARAAAQARRAHAPLLLVPASSGSTGGLANSRPHGPGLRGMVPDALRQGAVAPVAGPHSAELPATSGAALPGTRGAAVAGPYDAAAAAHDGDATAATGQAGDAELAAAGVMLRNELRGLAAREVLDVGVATSLLSAQLPGVRVITDPGQVPATRKPAALRHVVVLVRRRDHSAGTEAAIATARAAGARPVLVSGYDPRTDPVAIGALAAASPRQVLAIGAGFGPARRLAARVAVAATGVQLPGGGQLLFPRHRLLALYGYPGTPQLGALGEQGLAASIARIRRIAAAYQRLSRAPVVPTFEIIATVAQASPGADGSYSYESRLAALRPWVRRASAAGMYVVLDLQPGLASLLAQARKYRSLLRLPNVGLALDPEWKLAPGQLPLRQIGSVSITEVNGVIRWLAGLTARYRLPQKLLVLHQFRLSMITGEQQLDTGHDDLAIVIHMDGQGTPADKLQTWQAVTRSAPARVYFGWKNFYAKDTPTLSPVQTMANAPQPVMISYQ